MAPVTSDDQPATGGHGKQREARGVDGCQRPLDVDSYHRLASLTLEGIQDVFEDEADADATLAMDVSYAVTIERQNEINFRSPVTRALPLLFSYRRVT